MPFHTADSATLAETMDSSKPSFPGPLVYIFPSLSQRLTVNDEDFDILQWELRQAETLRLSTFELSDLDDSAAVFQAQVDFDDPVFCVIFCKHLEGVLLFVFQTCRTVFPVVSEALSFMWSVHAYRIFLPKSVGVLFSPFRGFLVGSCLPPACRQQC